MMQFQRDAPIEQNASIQSPRLASVSSVLMSGGAESRKKPSISSAQTTNIRVATLNSQATWRAKRSAGMPRACLTVPRRAARSGQRGPKVATDKFQVIRATSNGMPLASASRPATSTFQSAEHSEGHGPLAANRQVTGRILNGNGREKNGLASSATFAKILHLSTATEQFQERTTHARRHSITCITRFVTGLLKNLVVALT